MPLDVCGCGGACRLNPEEGVAIPDPGGGGSEKEEPRDCPMAGRWSIDNDDIGVLKPLPYVVVGGGEIGFWLV